MSADAKHATAAHSGHTHHSAEEEAAHIKHYTKIYVQLLILFLVSVAGPFVGDAIGSKAIVLVTAFGIALVKGYLVCAHFMHLNVEKRYIGYLLTTTVVFMLLFYAGVGPDVMEHSGRNWENVAAQEEVIRAQHEQATRPQGDHSEH
jgi:caa(3)-type oxidase subunit IV